MALTDDEVRQVAEELWNLMKSQSLDYSANTIIAPQTDDERSKVLIPAVDNREAKRKTGNIDMKSAFDAFGIDVKTVSEEVKSAVEGIEADRAEVESNLALAQETSDTATQKASEASQSASNASQSASNASSSASAAATSASQAASSANEASTQASNAASSASSAESAKTAAEAARDQAQEIASQVDAPALNARMDAIEAAAATESTTRANADTTLQNNINAEATARANADTTLQNNIDSESSARSSADASINSVLATAWKNNQSNLPSANNSFDIGSASQMIRNIYSMGMTLGVEGEDYDFDSNGGYITLNGGLLIWMGRVSASKSSNVRVSFSKHPFSSPICGLITCEHPDGHTSDANNYIISNTLTTTGMYVRCVDTNKTNWIAIGLA